MEEDISNNTGDVSNKTIVVLVILTVLISVLGTFVVLGEVSNIRLQSMHIRGGSVGSTGKVSLEIAASGPVAEPVNSAGYVTLEISPKTK